MRATDAETATDARTGEVPPPRPRLSWSRWALAALLVAAVVGFYALGLHEKLWHYLRTHLDRLKVQAREHPLAAPGLFFLVYVSVTALSLPSAALLSLLAGALLGRWEGTAVVGLASTLGATLAFLSSRYLFRAAVRRRLEAVDRGFERDGAFYLLTLRLVPVFPFFLINLGMGVTRMRAGTFAWVSLIGMLPATFLYVNAGSELGDIESPADVFSPGVLVSFALLGLLPLVMRRLVRRKDVGA